MKILLAYFLLLFTVFGCNSQDFRDADLKLITDKEIYNINDSIEITVLITPNEDEKTIRILKNLNNINISFRTKGKQIGFEQEANKKFIEFVNNSKEEKQYIDEYIISKNNPFKKVFKGRILERDNGIVFEIPELKMYKSFVKKELIKNSIIIVECDFYKVNSGIEESSFSKEFRVNI